MTPLHLHGLQLLVSLSSDEHRYSMTADWGLGSRRRLAMALKIALKKARATRAVVAPFPVEVLKYMKKRWLFLLLYDVSRSKNPNFPYPNYEHFDLERLEKVNAHQNFILPVPKEVMGLPDSDTCEHGESYYTKPSTECSNHKYIDSWNIIRNFIILQIPSCSCQLCY